MRSIQTAEIHFSDLKKHKLERKLKPLNLVEGYRYVEIIL
jgi:hypothetical protein